MVIYACLLCVESEITMYLNILQAIMVVISLLIYFNLKPTHTETHAGLWLGTLILY